MAIPIPNLLLFRVKNMKNVGNILLIIKAFAVLLGCYICQQVTGG